jgi:hypothetical protein
MWCCMYPSSFFRFKRLVEHQEHQDQDQDQDQDQQRENKNNNDNNDNNDNNNNMSDTTSITNITNNVEEFKILFRTQEKACYELRSENTVLKMKLEVANEMIRNQSKKIKSLKLKKNKLEIENNVYKNVMCGSSLSLNNNSSNYNNSVKCIKNEEHVLHAYPPPPPPPLPLPPPVNKMKANGNFQMNNVLDELKSKIKKIDE